MWHSSSDTPNVSESLTSEVTAARVNHHVKKLSDPSLNEVKIKCVSKSHIRNRDVSPLRSCQGGFYFWSPVCFSINEGKRARTHTHTQKKLLRASVISVEGTQKVLVCIRWRRKLETKGKSAGRGFNIHVCIPSVNIRTVTTWGRARPRVIVPRYKY